MLSTNKSIAFALSLVSMTSIIGCAVADRGIQQDIHPPPDGIANLLDPLRSVVQLRLV